MTRLVVRFINIVLIIFFVVVVFLLFFVFSLFLLFPHLQCSRLISMLEILYGGLINLSFESQIYNVDG